MKALGFEYREGRHASTPVYNGLQDGTPTGDKLEGEEPENGKHERSTTTTRGRPTNSRNHRA